MLKEFYPDKPVPTAPVRRGKKKAGEKVKTSAPLFSTLFLLHQPKLMFPNPKYNLSKASRDLGMTSYIPMRQSIKEQCDSFAAVGLI